MAIGSSTYQHCSDPKIRLASSIANAVHGSVPVLLDCCAALPQLLNDREKPCTRHSMRQAACDH